jgi:hypothetical protein
VIYREQGLGLALLPINGAAPGRSAGTALTNREGIATFVVRPEAAYRDPVFLQASPVGRAFGYHYAYSPSISVYIENPSP